METLRRRHQASRHLWDRSLLGTIGNLAAATLVSMDASTFLRLPPVMTTLAAAAQFLLTRRSRRSRVTSLLGAGVAVSGVAAAYLGSHAFTEADTTVDPTRPADASVLVTDGIFAYTRNPMYLGLTLVLVGHALHRRDFRALAPAAMFVGVIDRTQVVREEAALGVRFGEDYDKYRDDVRRWI